MSAILFGSIGTLADTSEISRQAFNEAFSALGLDWNWSREEYQSMLTTSGGMQRVQEYADAHGDQVDASAVHAKKSEIYVNLVGASDLSPRPGVLETVEEAKRNDLKLGFVTTTAQANIDAVLGALEPHLTADVFDVIVNIDSVDSRKPDAAAYEFALEQLGSDAASAVAIEDNVGGVQSAAAAGVRCIAFPNENTEGGDFSEADETVDSLDAERIVGLTAS